MNRYVWCKAIKLYTIFYVERRNYMERITYSAGVEVKRGQMWWANIPKDRCNPHSQFGLRPVVIVSNDKGNLHSPNILVCTLTTQEDKYKFIHPNVMGVNHTLSYVQCEQIRVIDKEMLGEYIGKVREVEQKYIDKALSVAIDLNHYFYDSKESEDKIAQLNGQIAELNSQIAELTCQVADYERQIEKLKEENERLGATIDKNEDATNLGNHVRGIFDILMKSTVSGVDQPPSFTSVLDVVTGDKLSSQPSCNVDQVDNKEEDIVAKKGVEIIKSWPLSAIEKFNNRVAKCEEIRKLRERDTSDGRCDKLGRPSAKKWTDQKIREFVKDYPTMETEALLKKYDLTNHYTANKYYLRFTNGQSL